MPDIYDFDAVALHRALDDERIARGLTWSGVAREIWMLSSVLNDQRRDHPLSPSTLANVERRRNTSCQHALFMLRWLQRTPESFLAGAPPRDEAALPEVGPDRRLRWNLARLYEALNEKRHADQLTWVELARGLRCAPGQLTGLRTAKYATNMILAMRITQWLDRPATDFVDARKW
jgi:hypothetical protein